MTLLRAENTSLDLDATQPIDIAELRALLAETSK
jgi:hypothetical protein